MNLLKLFLNNKHTSGAAVVYVIAYLVPKLGPIWFPGHAKQFEDTADIIQKAAVFYGLVSAGDAAQSQAQVQSLSDKTKIAIETHDTSTFSKPDAPSEPAKG